MMKRIAYLFITAFLLMTGVAYPQTLVRPTFVGNNTTQRGGISPSDITTDTTQPANQRRWLWAWANGVMHGQISNDNGTSPVDWITVTRSGDTITSIQFPTISTSTLSTNANGYFNFGTTVGSSGYGIRDNAGTLEFKNNAGVWQSLALPAPTGGGWTRSGSTIQPTTGTDNVLIGNLDKVLHASLQSGADVGAQIVSSISNLAAGGGDVNVEGVLGGTISTAIDATAKPVHLVLGAGTYNFPSSSGPTLKLAPGSIIEGQGKGVTILKVSANGVNADAITPGAHSVIRGLSIVGNTTASAGASAIDGCDCDDVTLDNVEISNFGGHGVNLGAGGAKNWKIINSYIHDNHDDAILVGSTVSGITIRGNRIENNGSNGVDLNGTDNRVEDNDIIGNGAQYSGGGFDCYGVLITSVGSAASADSNIVSGNRIRNNKCQQVNLRADNNGHTNYTVIKGNIISSNVAAGGAGVGINIDTSVGGTCGTVDFTSIEGNVVYGNSAQGILVGGGAGAPCIADYTTIHNNIVTGNTGMGVWIVYGNHATVKNNMVIGNTAGQVAFVDPAHNLDICNFTDGTTNLCTIGTGALAFNTFQPASGVATSFTTSGNTQFQLNSTGAGRRPYSFLLDNFGKWNLYDDTAAAVRMTVDSSGATNVAASLTVGGGGYISKILTGAATLDFPNTVAQTSSDLTIAVTGATDQDTCILGVPGAIAGSNQSFSCFVSGADTVTVRLNNYSAAAHNPGAGQFKVTLIRF